MKSISATHNNKTHFTRNASSKYGAFFVFKEVINTMKTHFFKRGIAGLLSLVMCLSAFIGLGTTTAFAAGEQAEVYLISFPRSGDANLDYSGTWGHSNLHYMNGWYSGESKYTTIRAMHSYDGNICYCIEPGTPQDTGDRYTSKDETFWDNLPSDFNSTISPYDMKLFIGRIMQYGYTGPISTSWRSQNASDAETLAQAMATQVLIWETVVGERDEDFNHISPGSYDAVKSVVSTAHPLHSQFISYYNSIEASVQRHSAIPSFMAKTPGKAQNVELAWNGTNYTATLTDSNNVLSNYSFSANEDGISFSVSGNKLVITAATAPSDSVRITASKSGATRQGIITWTDGRYAPGSGIQDVISYAQEVNDPVQAFLNLKVSYGSAKIIKTSEDGKVDNLTFTVTGNGVNQTVKTNSSGEIQIDNLMPGVYTVTEMDYDKYEPQESRRVTVVSGQVSTVNFNNKLKRGDLQIVKSSEDNLNEGVTFHLYGTSLSGIAVDEYAVTDANGVATFEDVLISGSIPYTVEEVDTAVRYVVPEAQSAPINWNEVTNRSFLNILKKFSVTVTKSDAENGTAQGDASLAGAVYGIYKGETLVDTYTTDKNGQFVTKEYICDNDWTVREITPSEGYLLDTTVHKVGAEPQLYTVEHASERTRDNSSAIDRCIESIEQYLSANVGIGSHYGNRTQEQLMDNINSQNSEWKEPHNRVCGASNLNCPELPDSENHFCGLPIERMANGSWGVISACHEAYDVYSRNDDDYTYENFDAFEIRTINAREIAGIDMISDREINNPQSFWGRSGGTYESFEAIARLIPEVQERIDSGDSLSNLMSDDRLGACASLFFNTDSSDHPTVYVGDGFYELSGGGRHRVMLAQILGYSIPVRVRGRIVHQQ